MAKTLKLGLAMGGGVSMGAFSGGGLMEAVKLLLLYGQYWDGQQLQAYDDVVIDVMSGASAGSVSLLIMIKALADYQSILPLIEKDTAQIEQELNEQFGKDYENLAKEKQEKLKAAHTAQLLQRKIWVEELEITKLFGDKIKKKKRQKDEGGFGLLSLDLFKSIVTKYLQQTIPNQNLKNRAILDKRVLFACSLTNLLPITVNDNESTNPHPYEQAIHEAISSKVHKEIRIIDLFFNKEASTHSEENFVVLSDKPKLHPSKTAFDINAKEGWAMMAATATACSAFPIAFEPVALNRFKYEYKYGPIKWPAELKDYDQYPFSYIDGGTLNNEPIKEAFSLAYYLDHKDLTTQKKIDRLILYIDPIVSEPKAVFKIQSYSSLSINSKFSKVISPREDQKLFTYATEIINVLRNEGSVVEEDKINSFLKNANVLTSVQAYLNQVKFTVTEPDQHLKLFKDIIERLQKDFEDRQIPLFNRDIVKILYQKAQKYSSYNANPVKEKDIRAAVNAIKNCDMPYDANQVAFWLKIYFELLAEQLLDYGGKNATAKRIAIAPMDFCEEEAKIIQLPGSQVQAFAGFASVTAKLAAFNFSRYCALKILSSTAFQTQENPHPYLKNLKNQRVTEYLEQYNNEFLADANLAEKVSKEFIENFPGPILLRLKKLVSDLNPLFKVGLSAAIKLFSLKKKIHSILKKPINQPVQQQLQFIVDTRQKVYDIFLITNSSIADQKKVKLKLRKGKSFLLLFLDTELRWSYKQKRNLSLQIDTYQVMGLQINGKGLPKNILPMPPEELIAQAKIAPNPGFQISIKEGQWQYEPKINLGIKILEEEYLGNKQ